MNFFTSKTPQQNGIVEYKNCTKLEIALVMLNRKGFLKDFKLK